MKPKTKKLSLKKVTVLNFEEARRITGATEDEGCAEPTNVSGCCGSQPGRDDSCVVCVTEEATCNAECFSY
jgi:hypothetical protein